VFIAAPAMETVLAAHAAADSGTKEPCGLLLGKSEVGRIEVADVRVLDNIHATPDRAFLLPAAGAVAAARQAREKGLAVVGVWHGHLQGPARLSESDAAGLASASRAGEGKAVETTYVFLVSGRGVGRARIVRAFVQQRARPREVRLDVALPLPA
jgi:proteasome lid subunit RPN8/RPN11